MRLPKILTNTALYTLSSFVQMGIGFLLLPIYTYYLTPEDYGVLNVITAITAFLSRLFLMSLHTAASRFHFKSELPSYRAKIWGTIFLMVLVNSIFWGVIVTIFHRFLIDPMAKGIQFYPLLFLSVLGTMLSPLYLFYQQWLRSNQNGVGVTIITIAYFVINALGNIICLIVLQLGVFGMVFSNFAVSFLFFVFSLYKFAPVISFKFNKDISIGAAKYSLPLVPHNLIGYWSGAIDKIFLNNLTGATSVGLFTIGSQFGGVINVMADSMQKAYSPWCFQIMTNANKEEYEKIYAFADMAVLICCLSAMVLSLFSPEVIELMTSAAYSLAWMPVTFVCFGYVAKNIYFLVVQPLFFSYTKHVMIVSLTSLVLSIVFNILLIPVFGFVGAGISLLAAMTVMAILTMIITIHLVPSIRFHYHRMLTVGLVFFLLSMSVFMFQKIETIYYRMILKILWVTGFLVISLYFNKNQLKLFINVLKHKELT